MSRDLLTLNRYIIAAAVFASHVGDRGVEHRPDQTYVVKTDSDTAKRSATGVFVTIPRR